jgi:hypothetical protein
MVDIEIRRGGRTSGKAILAKDAKPKIVEGNGMIGWDVIPTGIALDFEITVSKGKSVVTAWFKPSAFRELAEKMLSASPKEAEEAFLAALLRRAKAK